MRSVNRKKRIVLAILALLLVSCIAAAVWFSFPPVTDHKQGMATEYGVTDPYQLYENASVVAVVTYLEDVETIAVAGRGAVLPVTIGNVQVERVLKGTEEEEVLPIRFWSGTITLQEVYDVEYDFTGPYFRGILEELRRFRHRRDTVTLDSDCMVDARVGQRYLLFIGEIPGEENYVDMTDIKEYYAVMADGYGMLPLDEENRAYNRQMGDYFELDFLR